MNELSLCNLLSWAGRTGGVANAGVWTWILPRCSLRKLVAPNWTSSTVEHRNNGPNRTPAIPKRYPPPINVFKNMLRVSDLQPGVIRISKTFLLQQAR